MRSAFVAAAALTFAFVSSMGCGLFDVANNFTAGLDVVVIPSLEGARIGESCVVASDCRHGLSCSNGACQPGGSAEEGDYCGVSAECVEGLVCGIEAKCTRSGEAGEGESCLAPEDCAPGLRCNLRGLHLLCEPDGEGDVGTSCSGGADCLSPLQCSAAGVCDVIALAMVDGELFMPDAACDPDDEVGPFRVYFEVPRDDSPDEFYRLPFPNDARIRGGRLDMSGHHDPGRLYVGGSLVHDYLQALEDTFAGFSVNPTIFFRFSRKLDFDSVVGQGENQTFFFVNIDPESERYGRAMGMGWSMTDGRGKFICQNRIELRAGWGSPLEHGRTYAAFLTDGIRSREGFPPSQSADLGDLLSDTEPADSELHDAWERYASFRNYLTEQGVAPATVMGAAVFTTMNPDARMGAIREAVRAEPAPLISELTLCGDGVVSPCADGERETGCVNASGAFSEIHATYEALVWQRGTRPYLTKEDGGELVFAGGAPLKQGSEPICMAMSIPDGEMPEAGWPVLLYAHGTGGSFTSFIETGVAGRLADITLPGGRTTKMAVVGYDGVMHGPRRGETDLDPDPLFYNFANPLAARGNFEQAAADLFALQYLVERAAVTALDSPTGSEIRFDPDNIYFMGHSQGSQGGPLYASYEPHLRGVVLSGAGGGLALSIVNKTQPVDIASAVAYVLTDGEKESVSASDPFLTLLQMYVDPIDPLNYGRMLFVEPPEAVPAKHVMMSYGYGDSYTPEPCQKAFAQVASIPAANPYPGDLSYGLKVSYPVSGNRSSGDEDVTVGLFPALPEDYDGHFVMFRDADLSSKLTEFLGTAVLDGTPTITER